jgi:hypothetical protein
MLRRDAANERLQKINAAALWGEASEPAGHFSDLIGRADDVRSRRR